ncbi:TnsA-like heteromeric transposase endonuclease subunit [Pseudarthrobacter sp. Y6]|uniref:TnsA-like heteromeric transposase endonuclease subunit n=1 Tax=Pseudarthrobacter sp. Y6 TaxID=3418422 RepID=UPI003CEDCAE3
MGRSTAASDTLAGQHDPAGTLTFRGQFNSAPTTAYLADCWMVPFELVRPIRSPAAFKGQRNFAGLWWCGTNGRHVGFESWCERDHLMSLDFDPDVIGISSQPFRIALPAPLPQHSHVPDYFVRRGDGSAVVLDVRPDTRVKPADQDVFQATEGLCTGVGWSYQRLGALPSVYLANLRWLAGYRHPRCSREPVATLLTDILSNGPATLRDLTAAAGDPVTTVPTLFHLLWRHKICTDLHDRPLGKDTLVSLQVTP